LQRRQYSAMASQTNELLETKLIYRTDGEWVALVQSGHLFDTTGEWVGWLDGADVYTIDGEYVGYISDDGRMLRSRVRDHRKRRKPPQDNPSVRLPQTIPLPPMFAELPYSEVDVFEEEPDLFAKIHELRPDSGERPLVRLTDSDPKLAVQKKLQEVEQDLLEEMVYGLIYSYGASEPPVPVEAMAAGLQPEQARRVQLAPPQERLRLTERFVGRLGLSSWAKERGYCGPEGFSLSQIQYAARALLLPRRWILNIPRELRQPQNLAQRYVVPEETAMLRIHDLE
jgi:hypothetical protein